MQILNPPLIPGEVEILSTINAWHSPIVDCFMFMLSNVGAWIPIVAVLLYYLFDRKPWQEALLFILCIGLCILICDRLSSGFAKPFFARPRPTHWEGVRDSLHIVFGCRGSTYGFFSGHASNFFSVALLMSRIIRQRLLTILVFTLVSLVAYSRMYLGVHFLSDILVGVGLGLIIGYLVSLLYEYLRQKVSPQRCIASSKLYMQGVETLHIALIVFLPILWAYSWQWIRILKMIGYY